MLGNAHAWWNGTGATAARLGLALALVAALPGCASDRTRMYIDPALPMYSESDLPHSAQPRPVQLVFEFRTNGEPNPIVTASQKTRVLAIARQSGLFTEIADSPAGGDMPRLAIVIDNIAETAEAAHKGLKSGLTMGVSGGLVADDFQCTAAYSWHGTVLKTAIHHEVRTAFGSQPGPADIEAKDPVVAVRWVIDQITWNVLKNLADQRAFE